VKERREEMLLASEYGISVKWEWFWLVMRSREGREGGSCVDFK
jgi:hypothetical protein